MRDLNLNLINNDCNSNTTSLLNNTNASLGEIQYTNKLYSTNNKCNSKKNEDIKDLFMIFHQNIRGLKGKTEELMISLHKQLPNVICLSEHHMTDHEIDAVHIPKYKLGAKFCRKKLKNGGVCIYIQQDLKFATINLQKYCKEQDLEIAAIQISINKDKIIICSI
jgi:hypothetical protein